MGIAKNPDGTGGLGYGQNVSQPVKTSGVMYYNTTGKPIHVNASFYGATGGTIYAEVGGTNSQVIDTSGGNMAQGVSFVVPIGKSYRVVLGGGVTTKYNWSELS